MVDFICKGYLELSETQVERELQNEKFLPTVGFEPGAYRLRSKGATTELRRLMSVEGIKVYLILTLLFLEIYLQHMVDVTKKLSWITFCRFFTISNFVIGQKAKRYKYYII